MFPYYFPSGTLFGRLRASRAAALLIVLILVLLCRTASPGSEDVRPDATAAASNGSCNTTTAHGNLDDDVDSGGDGNECTATANSSDHDIRLNFANPSANPNTGANLQTFKVLAKKNVSGGSGTPTVKMSLYCNGALVTAGSANNLTDNYAAYSQTFTFNSGSCAANGSDVEVLLDCTSAGSGPNQRSCSYEAAEWVAVSGDADANLTSSATVSEPVAISSVADTSGERVAVFDFTVSDGGTADGLTLDISQIILHTSGTGTPSDLTWQLQGPDANYVTGTYSSGSGTITFSGLSISVPNSGSETYTVYAYFTTTPSSTDGQTFILSVDGDTDVTVGGGSTRFGSTSAVNNGTGSTMDVVHSELRYSTQPPSTAVINTDFTGSIVVKGTDVNGNVDTAFTENVTLAAVKHSDHSAGGGVLSSTDGGGLTHTASSGVATWTDTKYTLAEKIDIKATSTTYSSGIYSTGTTVFNAAPNTRYWVGSAGGSTNSASNWANASPASCTGGGAGVPGSSDTAVFTSGCTNNAAIDAALSVYNLQVNSGYTGTLTQTASITVGGDWTQTAGTFSGGSQAVTVSGNVSLNGGSFTSTSGTLSVEGDWDDTGVSFTHNSGTVDFTKATGTQTLTTLGTQTYNAITHSGAGTLQLSTWKYRRLITVDHTKFNNVASPSTTYANYPLLVSLSGLSNINAGGTDVRFTASDGKTLLPREIEKYSSGSLQAWVKITPTKDAGDASDDTYYMYYGNSSASEPAAGSTYGSQNVWDSNFVGVWHMSDAGPNTVADSTANGFNGTQTNGITFGVTGQAGSALSFDNPSTTTPEYVSVPDNNTLDFGTSAFSAGVWFKTTTSVATVLFDKFTGTAAPRTITDDYWAILINASGTVSFRLSNFGGSNYNATTASSYNDGNWHYAVGVRTDATHSVIYVDNESVQNNAVSNLVNVTTTGDLDFSGFKYVGTPNDVAADMADGDMDEGRLSNTNRSTDWINAEYSNINSPATFATAGSEAPVTFTAAGAITISAGTFDSNGRDINVAGNWSNSGTFTASSDTVTFNGTSQQISGSTTFYNFTKNTASADSLKVASSTTQTITNTLTLSGASGQLLTLDTVSGGSPRFTFDVTGGNQNVTYLSVKNSQASSNNITADSNSTNAGGNDDGEAAPHWIFSGASSDNGEANVLQSMTF